MSKNIKVDIFSGFLGAGKTTLIKKLLQEAFKGEKLALIENEFGEIGVDGKLLGNSGVEVSELNSGCICCSLVGDFKTALKQVVDDYAPDRIIIEPSGVGKLSDVIKAVNNTEIEGLVLNSTTTVVDAGKAKMYSKNFGEFFDDQIKVACTVILSRTQNVDDSKVMDAAEIISGLNEHCSIVTTPWESLTGEKILEAIEGKSDLIPVLVDEMENPGRHYHDHGDGNLHFHPEEEHEHDHDHDHEHHHDHDHDHDHEHHHDHDHEHEHHHDHDHEHEHHHDHDHDHHHDHGEACSCGHHHDHDHEHHHHHADEVFSTWGVETPRKYDEAELKEILGELDESHEFGTILRAKGFVEDSEGKWHNFDLVPGEFEINETEPEVTGKINVIGSDLNEDKLKTLFKLG